MNAQLQETEPSIRANAQPAAAAEPPSPKSSASAAKPAAVSPDQPSQQPAASSSQSPAAFAISSSAALAGRVSTAATSSPAASAGAAASALAQVIETADKMRSDGQTHVEVRMNLDDGQQLTVRLQMSQGSVRPVFKTESPELRQAIEQNWAGFRSSASERGLQISSPVFESPSAGGGFSAFANRDQSRNQGGNTSDAENPETYSVPALSSLAKPTTPQQPAAALAGSGVQLYA
jgi:hypothetical protein